MRRLLAILLVLSAVLGLRAVAGAAESDKGLVAGLLSKALSSDGSNVSIGAVEGALSSDVVIRDVVVADADGPWLKLDSAHLVWNRLALLQRRLDVVSLQVGRLEMLRRPLPNAKPAAGQGNVLPELPLKVIVKALAIDRIALGAPVLGVAAHLSASGAATLGPPAEGLDLKLDAQRVDAPGAFAMTLAFVPDTSKLTVHAKFDEPASGLVSRVAKLPGAPPIDLTIDGDGPLDAFVAKLALVAGPAIGAAGHLELTRQGAARRLTATLRARIAGLLPAIASEPFAGETALDASANIGDDGTLTIDALHVVSQTAQCDVGGLIDASRKVALSVQAESLPGAPDIGAFAFTARATGPIDEMALDAEARVSEAKSVFGAVGAFDAHFRATPSGPYADPVTRLAIEGDARASGVALADPALAAAVGANVALDLKGDADMAGIVHVATLNLTMDALTANFSGDVSSARVAGNAALAVADLSRLGALSGLGLHGVLEAKADLEAFPQVGAANATVDASATKFSTGTQALDGFSGGHLNLAGGLSRLADGGFGFQDLRLVGGHGSARIDGRVASDKAALHAEIDVPEVHALDARAFGRAKATADLAGALAHLDATIAATLKDGRLMDRPAQRLNLSANLSDVTGLVRGEAKLDGLIDARPAIGEASIAKRADGGLDLQNLSLTLGAAHLDGHLALAPDRTAVGHLTIAAPRLDDLSPLALTKLGGALDASLELAAAKGRQDVAIRAKSPGLSVGATDIAGLDVDLQAEDVFAAPVVAGHAVSTRVKFGSESVSAIKLVANPAAAGSDVDLGFSARGLDVIAHGLLAAGVQKFTLSRFQASGAGRRVGLQRPAMLAWGGGAIDIDRLALDVDGGKLNVAGRVGDTLELELTATKLPLAVLNVAKPDLCLVGVLDAEASLRGSAQNPEGKWRASIAGLGASQMRASGVSALSVEASGAVAAGRTTLDATLDAAKGGSLHLSGSAPLSTQGSIDLRVTGKLDLALANPVLAVSGERLAGNADVDLRVQGVPAKPSARGTISVSHGAFSDEDSGFKAENVEASLRASGDILEITRSSASTPNGGTLAATGAVRLDPGAGFPGALRVTGKRALLASNAVLSAVADLQIEIGGALARSPKATGRVDIDSMDIEIPGRLPSQAIPLPDARHISPGPTARERLALAEKTKARAASAAPFVIALGLKVDAPGGIFVRGRGVDAELRGALTLGGTSAHPQASGGFSLRRGTFALLGKQLDFSRGIVTFRGDPMPDLDMLAQTTVADITATVAITGSAATPTFTFSSQPALAQDEILSRILFNSASGSLSPIQALELANAASSLSGGPDTFERLRKSLGVDSLAIGSDSSGGATVGVRHAIDNRLSLGATSGAKPEDNGVSLDFDLTKRLRLQAGVNAAGGSSAGAGYQFEY